jgi:hypothetical protein
VSSVATDGFCPRLGRGGGGLRFAGCAEAWPFVGTFAWSYEGRGGEEPGARPTWLRLRAAMRDWMEEYAGGAASLSAIMKLQKDVNDRKKQSS